MARKSSRSTEADSSAEQDYEQGYSGTRVDPFDDSRYQADSDDHPTVQESRKAAAEARAERAGEEADQQPAPRSSSSSSSSE